MLLGIGQHPLHMGDWSSSCSLSFHSFNPGSFEFQEGASNSVHGTGTWNQSRLFVFRNSV